MEVMVASKFTDKVREKCEREGCLIQPFTINSEDWIYIVHPVMRTTVEEEV